MPVEESTPTATKTVTVLLKVIANTSPIGLPVDEACDGKESDDRAIVRPCHRSPLLQYDRLAS